MSAVVTVIELDQAKGTAKFSMDLKGATEFEHELLAAIIGTGRSVSIVPAHKQDELYAEFTIRDTRIWPTAMRALENRKRKADGRPSVEEEEKQIADAKAAEEEAASEEPERSLSAEE